VSLKNSGVNVKLDIEGKIVREVPNEATFGDLLRDLRTEAPDLVRGVVAVRMDGQLLDTHTPVPHDGRIELVRCDSPDGLSVMRHSAAHVLAQAVLELLPGTKLGIGPPIRDGFYYDFDVPRPLTEEDLAGITERMRRIVAEDLPFRRVALARSEAVKLLEERDERFKLELLFEIAGDQQITMYETGDGEERFRDLCAGPHVPSTGLLKHFELLSVAGAYWRGREVNPVMQRVYGTAFCTDKQLRKHLHLIEELKKRDHRVLNRRLDLYSMHDEVGPGLVHWHPHGAVIRSVIEDFWRTEHVQRGYQLVYTPHIASERVYEISGHLENYAEEMYAPIDVDGQPYRLKPMNCPGHIMIYKSRLWSYRELPVRYAELGTVYRYERSGVLHGLLRVRGFTQDDGHVFCTPEQLTKEVAEVLRLVKYMMDVFGYKITAYLATRPPKAIGSPEAWVTATKALQDAMKFWGWEYQVDEGGGVFYGPKIDVKMEDALGREWQGPTIQVDLNLPERFDATYVGPDNTRHRVVMVHRAILGSLERFIGGLVEHNGGAFPLWLAPVQVAVLSVSEKSEDYAGRVGADLARDGLLRVETDTSSETVGKKVREAELQKIPYVLVVGPQEEQGQTVAVRRRGHRGVDTMTLNDFYGEVKRKIYEEMHPDAHASMRGDPNLSQGGAG
jgi:threonyl-tRNA synthetase